MPNASHASMYSISLRVSICPLTILAMLGQLSSARTIIRFVTLFPNTATMVMQNIINGKDINMSAKRIMTMSIKPP
ncbi:hypothetical protein SDC9_82855 [bioreactor metagenome]|uniref:Uncharacterized protein n=1 Tax=bioreactor metagenome TaxID=1076179 RepID=A0A644Z619_9ZZZZ